MRLAPFLVAAVLLGLASSPAATMAQDAELVASLSRDSVGVAEVFELEVRVPVPPGSVVYFPDTLPTTPDIESYAPVQWRAERGPEGGATVELTYSLIPFGAALVALPRLDVVTVPAEAGLEGERIPGGSRVGPWSEVPLSARYMRSVAGQTVWVEPVYTSDDIVAGMSPRPPGDVLGLSWSWPSIALILLFASVIGGAVVTSTREWLANRAGPLPDSPARPLPLGEAKRLAIAELDRLLTAGRHEPERAREIYATSSDIVRRYAGRLDPDWGAELTSTELTIRLERSGHAEPALIGEMARAEAVKFGRLRPAARETERHLIVLRDWMRGAPEVKA